MLLFGFLLIPVAHKFRYFSFFGLSMLEVVGVGFPATGAAGVSGLCGAWAREVTVSCFGRGCMVDGWCFGGPEE